MPLHWQVYVYTVCSLIYATFYFNVWRIINSQNINPPPYFNVWRIINSQNINSPSGTICRIFDNFFLRLIRIMKLSRINTLHLFIFLRTNNCAIISLELWTLMNIKLSGNTVGSFPIVSKISSSKFSKTSSYVLTIVPSSCNVQWYLNKDIVILSQVTKIEVDVFVNEQLLEKCFCWCVLVSYHFHMKKNNTLPSFVLFLYNY